MARLIEIEIDEPKNRNPVFFPAGVILRSRLDWVRTRDPAVYRYDEEFGPIPGQRLIINLDDGTAAIEDDLVLGQGSAADLLRKKIEKKKMSLPDARTVFDSKAVHLPTWLFWARKLVEAGQGKLTSRSVPLESWPVVKRTEVQTRFMTYRHGETEDPALEAQRKINERQSHQIDSLLTLLKSLVPAEKRQELEMAMAAPHGPPTGPKAK